MQTQINTKSINQQIIQNHNDLTYNKIVKSLRFKTLQELNNFVEESFNDLMITHLKCGEKTKMSKISYSRFNNHKYEYCQTLSYIYNIIDKKFESLIDDEELLTYFIYPVYDIDYYINKLRIESDEIINSINEHKI